MYLAEYYIHIINQDSCKLFSRSSKLTHAFLPSNMISKTQLIGNK